LAQYYGNDNQNNNNNNNNHNSGGGGGGENVDSSSSEAVFDPLNINSPHFDAKKYVQKTLDKRSMSEVMERERLLNNDIKRLDMELQTLVYENYNKFITATDTIKKMKTHVESMEDEMSRLMGNMDKITSCSDAISRNLSTKRERIDKLSSVSRMLKKMQFLLELPKRLRTCLDMKAYPVAVKYYNMANKILNQYRDLPSFQSIHKDSEQVMSELKNQILYRIVRMQSPLTLNASTGSNSSSSSSSAAVSPMTPTLTVSPTSALPSIVSNNTNGTTFYEYKKNEDIEAVTLLLQLGEDWREIRTLYTSTRKSFIDTIIRQLPSNTKNIKEFIDQLNSHVINRAIDWIQVYFTAFHKLDGNEDYFINWIGRDIFQSVYLTRAREHLVDTLVASQASSSNSINNATVDDPSSLLLTNTKLIPAQDFRHAMFQMWYQITTRVHILIPEAKMSEKASNLVSDTVKAYMEYEMNRLRASMTQRISALSRTNPNSVKQEKDLDDLLLNTCNSIIEDVKIVASYFYTLINNSKSQQSSSSGGGGGGRERIESPTDESFQVLVARKEIFNTWIQTSVMRVIEDVCADMSNRVMPHSQAKIYVGKEAEEASKLPEIKQKKAIAAISASMKKQLQSTPTGQLLVCRLCRDLSRDHMKKVKSSLDEQFSIRSKAALFDMSHLDYCLQSCAQQYLVGFIEAQGQRLNKFIRTGIESHDWFNDSDVVRGVRHGIVSVVKEMGEISDFVNRVFPVAPTTGSSSTSGGSSNSLDKKKREASSFSYASMNQSDNQQDIVKDVMKIFNKKLSTFRITPPILDTKTEVKPSKILIEIMKIALKTFEECVRMCTFGKDGFQQLQVDAHFLRVMWSRLVNDDKVISSLVNEAMSSCAERCLELSPLDQNIVQTLVDKKIAQLEERS